MHAVKVDSRKIMAAGLVIVAVFAAVAITVNLFYLGQIQSLVRNTTTTSVMELLALPQNQPNAPLYPAGGAPGSRPGALPHFGRPRYLGPPPRARSTAG